MYLKSISIICFFVFQFSTAQNGDVYNNNLYDYQTVEYQPQYAGGFKEFLKYISRNYRAPEVEGLSGVLKIDFVIETNGTISSVKIINEVGEGAGDEAVRVLLKCPNWSPGQQNGKKVRVIYHNFPITIRN
ncbi:energy transducer TonB [Flavobacterium sinopsychrotolerans]|jgi:protein TonB|uniref:TonB protein C-terminal n=1 Tax=Flavobacterium sinopsychrotolerans TaxID=604089 RepID=A0A1H8QTW9_9FLAO|nr:energy transducer TonB [Flavobacterium sinopsychrotolerans]SEO57253.1 TonB protein C-terminal [Flavobacterium sinopsychrotolerans]